jgi:hypothetical protein
MAITSWPGFCLEGFWRRFAARKLTRAAGKALTGSERFTSSLTARGEVAAFGRMILRGLS